MSRNQPDSPRIDGSDLFFGIVAARYNSELVEALIDRVLSTLEKEGRVPEQNVEVLRVPGSNELAYAANMYATTGQFDCVIALGLVLAGQTDHHRIIADSTASAFQSIGMITQVPVINGVLTVADEEQAAARITGELDRGREFALAALQMAWHKVKLVERLEDLDAADQAAMGDEDDDDFMNPFKN